MGGAWYPGAAHCEPRYFGSAVRRGDIEVHSVFHQLRLEYLLEVDRRAGFGRDYHRPLGDGVVAPQRLRPEPAQARAQSTVTLASRPIKAPSILGMQMRTALSI